MSEQVVNIAKQMYDSRRLALSLLGPEKFKAKIAEYQPLIHGIMKKLTCNEIVATTDLIRILVNGGHDGMPVMLALAACVELLEPTEGL